MICWHHNCHKHFVNPWLPVSFMPEKFVVAALVPPSFIIGSKCTKGMQLLDFFFSWATSPSAICSIEGCDVTAVVIVFPVKASNKVLLNEGETFDSSNSKVSLQLCHIETSSRCEYSFTFGSFMISFLILPAIWSTCMSFSSSLELTNWNKFEVFVCVSVVLQLQETWINILCHVVIQIICSLIYFYETVNVDDHHILYQHRIFRQNSKFHLD